MKQLLTILLVFLGALGLCAGCLDAVEDPRPGPMPDQVGADFDPRPIRGGPATNTYGSQNTYGEVYASGSGSGSGSGTASPTEDQNDEVEDQPITAGTDGAGGAVEADEDIDEENEMGGADAG